MKKRVFFTFLLACCGLVATSQRSTQGSLAASTAVINGPVLRAAAAFASSPPVRSFSKQSNSGRSATGSPRPREVREVGGIGQTPVYPPSTHDGDGSLARPNGLTMPPPAISFNGLSNYDNIDAYNAVIIPPDMIGDIGPNHYVQAVNALVRVFDKSGNALTPPFKMSQLFAPLGTPCSQRNDGEPVVLYDPLADRWMVSQYCNNFPPFRQMIAISKTGDPTGGYFVYEYVMPGIKLNDVAKFGVWPDGYYMSTEEFTGADFSGTGMFAFDRSKMLAGDPTAAYIYFSRPSPGTARLGNLLPADLDGIRPPPKGAPNVFTGYTATEYGDAQDAITLFDFHPDFADPSSSYFTERPESPVPVAAFDPTSPEGRADITQPAPGERLDANSDRLNYRAAYRNLGDTESIVVNQTVRLSVDPYRAGVRLYELRRSGGAFAVAQQSTIGNATSSRWIGSAAQDHLGGLAVGYNVVSDVKQPWIVYTGKAAGDPTGTIRNEQTLINGTGVQKAFGWRWGDYSGMSVDPVDDCTFWMTGQYYTLESQQFSDFTWLTRIGAFKFPECTAAPRAIITGRVTNALTGLPIANARVTARESSRSSDGNGAYGNMAVLPGSYTVTASAAGYRSESFVVNAAEGLTIVQNFSLQPIPVLVTTATALSSESCGPNGAPDPGETVTIAVTLRNTGALPATNLIASILTGGGVIAPGPPQTYGAMPVNGPGVTREFSFTVDPAVPCGSRITLTLVLFDGTQVLGTVAIPLQTGTPKVAFSEKFDRTSFGFLPARWTRSSANGQGLPDTARNWRVSAARSRSVSKSAYSPDPIQVGLNEMVTPAFVLTTGAARLTFANWYDLETTFLRNRRYDGSVLEIRIGSGEWQDIVAAGGVFESGGYDGPIDACCQNPLAGHNGWSGRSGINQTAEFITTAVKLPGSVAGQLIQVRWRVGTDVGGFREGQYIDDLLVTDGFVCACSSLDRSR
ncbi:MAG: carboxypeptidase regulatory-like domain-containing protein [Pyrinomonadaceae bacterium]